MTDPSLVHMGSSAARQTHVLLIGVGTYEHLLNGPEHLAADHFGLDQLTSPPASARALAEWFIEGFDCPDRPLGSVRLLLSEASPARFRNPRTGAQYAVPDANLVNTRAAAIAWSEAATGVDDQLIF